MKIFLIYRNNELFQEYIPRIMEDFDVVGTFVVPAGVSYESIAEEAIEAAEDAKSKGAYLLVSDETCRGIAYKPTLSDKWKDRFKRSFCGLDYIFSRQIEEGFCNSTSVDNLVWFALQVVNGRNLKKVIVVQECISDHHYAGSDNCRRIPTEERSIWVSNHLQDLFPEARIQVVGTLDEALPYASDPELLLVADRHCGVKDIMSQEGGWYNSLSNWPHECMIYMLPFETCAANLISLGSIDFRFDVAKMKEIITSW
ncbi:hypothetical protein ACFL08_01165 [Patescibacteria group bacterium]